MTADKVTYTFRHILSITGKKETTYSVADFNVYLWEAQQYILNAFFIAWSGKIIMTRIQDI